MKQNKTIILALAVAQLSMAQAFAADEAATYFSRDYGVKHAKGFAHTAKSDAFMKKVKHVSFKDDNTSVPKTYSIRGKAGPVEDQGQCGSCWDFSLTTVLRGTWIMAGKDPGRLSFNYLLNCATTMQGCNGGDFSAADFLIAPKGAPAYGADGAYTQADGTCQAKTAVASTVDYKMLGQEGSATVHAAFKDIAFVVGVLHKPVSIDIAASNAWEMYGGGVYNKCAKKSTVNDINHMVTIEGYDCETAVDANGNCKFDKTGNLPAGVGTWLVRNSWGESWGDNGYITMKATDKNGNLCDQVAADALYFDVQ